MIMLNFDEQINLEKQMYPQASDISIGHNIFKKMTFKKNSGYIRKT